VRRDRFPEQGIHNSIYLIAGNFVYAVRRYSITRRHIALKARCNLGITFDVKLNFSSHISDKADKADSIIGIIKRNFRFLSQESFVMLNKALVRPHLEYANAVWSPYKKCDIYIYNRRSSKEGNKRN